MFWEHTDALIIKIASLGLKNKEMMFFKASKDEMFFHLDNFAMTGTSDNRMVQYQENTVDELE